jgi:hypothetical protein
MKVFPLSRGTAVAKATARGNVSPDGPGYPRRLCRLPLEGRFRREANHVGLAGASNDGNSLGSHPERSKAWGIHG